jgi:DmsE family decaheme c-type cytochrome
MIASVEVTSDNNGEEIMAPHRVTWAKRLGAVGLVLAWATGFGVVAGWGGSAPGDVALAAPVRAVQAAQAAPVIQEPVVPTSTCLTCHDRVADTRLHQFHSECQTCHTGASVHIEAPEVGNIGRPAAAQCLTCHSGAMKTKWEFGPHEKAEVACLSCHTIHASRTATGATARGKRMDQVSATCASCHQATAAQFRLPSHHPVTEGAMGCINCHDPHSGAKTAVRSETELCGSCHQNQRTPKAISHAPVTEGCTTCHNPHGSANRRLLSVSQPALCVQCHSLADNRHAIGATARGALGGAVLRNCVSCHKAIHGSQSDRHLRF